MRLPLVEMLLLVLLASFAWATEPPASVTAWLDLVKPLVQATEAAEESVIPGQGGWLFFMPELRHLTVGPFWGANAVGASQAKPEYADPLPAILDFDAQCKQAGVELLFVPVPEKAALYPEQLAQPAPQPTPATEEDEQPPLPPRVDVWDAEFLALLKSKGVHILDLTPELQRWRQLHPEQLLWCKQDSHWSSQGCAAVAKIIAKAVKDRPWLAGAPKHNYHIQTSELELTGDLWGLLGDEELPRERLPLLTVLDGSNKPAADWRESPVLLLGDSHCLIFHSGGDMQATGAGLADHLAFALGFPLDVVGVRGSGATPCRFNLLRRADNLAGKKLVIWCLTAREYTQGQGWRNVPVVK